MNPREAVFRLAAVLDLPEYAIITNNLDGNIEGWSPGAERLYGYCAEEAQGLPISALVSAGEQQQIHKVLDSVQRGKTVHLAVIEARRKNGAELRISVTAGPIRDDQSRITGGMILARAVAASENGDASQPPQARIESLLRVAPLGIYMTDSAGACQYVNEAWCRLVGVPREQALGLGWTGFLHPEDRERVVSEWNERVALRQPFQSEFRFLRPDGNVLWCLSQAAPEIDSHGRLAGYVGAFTDITGRKRAEQTERALGRLLENSLNEIYIFDADTLRFLEVNRGARENLGYSMDELRDLTPLDLKPDFTPEVFADLMRPLRTREREMVEFITRHRRRDGSFYPVEVHLQTATFDSRLVFVAIILDVTERMRSEETMRRLAAVVTDSSDAITVQDFDGRILDWNRAAERLYGYTKAEALAMSVLSLVPEAKHEEAALVRHRLSQGEEVKPFESRRITKDGRVIDIWLTLTTLRDRSGTPLAIATTESDLTERKAAQAQRESLIRLETKNAELERFAYTVSHDLKSPLVTIKGFLSVLEQDLAKSEMESVRSDMARISRAADQMKNLLDQLLELSRIGRFTSPPSEVDLGELARQAAELLAGPLTERGVRLEIDPDLPKVQGDQLRLLGLFQNLIENALKFMGDQPEPRVEVGCHRQQGEEVFFVRDNGVGIDPAFHDKVFGLFDQLDAKTDGAGIGLAMAKRIVEVHGGRLWVQSEGAGRGSAFCFTLGQPVAPASLQVPPA